MRLNQPEGTGSSALKIQKNSSHFFNKWLATSFNVARVGKANLPFSRGYNPLLNGKMESAAKGNGVDFRGGGHLA